MFTLAMKINVRHPVRRPSHLFTDDLQVNHWITFDDQFIMDMSDDKAVTECLYGVAENVAADGLDDILHKFRSVGFDAYPFLCRAHAFIGDGFSAVELGICIHRAVIRHTHQI